DTPLKENKTFKAFKQIYEPLTKLNTPEEFAKYFKKLTDSDVTEVFVSFDDVKRWDGEITEAKEQNREPSVPADMNLRIGTVLSYFFGDEAKSISESSFESVFGRSSESVTLKQQIRKALETSGKGGDLFAVLEGLLAQKDPEGSDSKSKLTEFVQEVTKLKDFNELASFLRKMPEEQQKEVLGNDTAYAVWRSVQEENAAYRQQHPEEQIDETKATEAEKAFFQEQEFSYKELIGRYAKEKLSEKSREYLSNILKDSRIGDVTARLDDYAQKGSDTGLDLIIDPNTHGRSQEKNFIEVRRQWITPQVRSFLRDNSIFEIADTRKKNSQSMALLNLEVYRLNSYIVQNKPYTIGEFTKAVADMQKRLEAVDREPALFEGEEAASRKFAKYLKLVDCCARMLRDNRIITHIASLEENQRWEAFGDDADNAKWVDACRQEEIPRAEGEEGEPRFRLIPPERIPGDIKIKFGTILGIQLSKNESDIDMIDEYGNLTGNRDIARKDYIEKQIRTLMNKGAIPFAEFMEILHRIAEESNRIREADPESDRIKLADTILQVEVGGREGLLDFISSMLDNETKALLSTAGVPEQNYTDWQSIVEDHAEGEGDPVRFFENRRLDYGRILKAYVERKGSQTVKEYMREVIEEETRGSAQGKIDTFLASGKEGDFDKLFISETFEYLSGVKDILREASRFEFENEEKARTQEMAMLNLAIQMFDYILKEDTEVEFARFTNALEGLEVAMANVQERNFFAGEDRAAAKFAKLKKIHATLAKLKDRQVVINTLKEVGVNRAAGVLSGDETAQWWEAINGGQAGADVNKNVHLRFGILYSYYVYLHGEEADREAYGEFGYSQAGAGAVAEKELKLLLVAEPMKYDEFAARFRALLGTLVQDNPSYSDQIQIILRTAEGELFAQPNGKSIGEYLEGLSPERRQQLLEIQGEERNPYEDWAARNLLPRKEEDAELSGNENFFKNYEIDYGRIVNAFLLDRLDEDTREYYRVLTGDGDIASVIAKVTQFRQTGADAQLYEAAGNEADAKGPLLESVRRYLQKKSRLGLEGEKAASQEAGELNLRILRIDEIMKKDAPTTYAQFVVDVNKLSDAMAACVAAGVFEGEQGNKLRYNLFVFLAPMMDLVAEDRFVAFINTCDNDEAATVFATGDDFSLWREEGFRLRGAGGQNEGQPGGRAQANPPAAQKFHVPENSKFRFGTVLAKYVAEKGDRDANVVFMEQTGNASERGRWIRRMLGEFASLGTVTYGDMNRKARELKTQIDALPEGELAQERALIALLEPFCEGMPEKVVPFFRFLHPATQRELLGTENNYKAWEEADHPGDPTAEATVDEQAVLIKPMDYGRFIAAYVERRGSDPVKAFYRELSGRQGESDAGENLQNYLTTGTGEEKLYEAGAPGADRVMLPAVADLLKVGSLFDGDVSNEVQRRPEMQELNLLAAFIDALIRDNAPATKARFSAALEAMMQAAMTCLQKEIWEPEIGQEIMNLITMLAVTIQKLLDGNVLTDFVNAKINKYRNGFFGSNEDLVAWRLAQQNAQGGAMVVPEGTKFKFGTILAAYNAENMDREFNDAFMNWTGNTSEKGTFAARAMKAFLAIGQKGFAEVKAALRETAGQYDAQQEENAEHLALIGLLRPCFGANDPGELAKFFRKLHPLFKREICGSEATYTTWNNAVHPEGAEDAATPEEIAFFNTNTLQYSRLMQEYVERGGEAQVKTTFRTITGMQGNGDAAENIKSFIEDGGARREEALYTQGGQGENKTLLPGVQEGIRGMIAAEAGKGNPMFQLDEEAMRLPEMAEVNLRLMVMNRHLRGNQPATLARFSADVEQLKNALSKCMQHSYFSDNPEAREQVVRQMTILMHIQSFVVANRVEDVIGALSDEEKREVLPAEGLLRWVGAVEEANAAGGNARITLPPDTSFRF
ncbi:MAG: hypothetical protein IJV04_00360, partial [Lachnospiraceae bacterium]|nr:hypothetical protein [Lachnospiraceae bacterium]